MAIIRSFKKFVESGESYFDYYWNAKKHYSINKQHKYFKVASEYVAKINKTICKNISKKREHKMTELETQDGKLKIYFRDESITVIHNVIYFTLEKTVDRVALLCITYVKKNPDIKFDAIKGDKYITNYPVSKLLQDGQVFRATPQFEVFTTNYVSGNYDNYCIRVDWQGNKIWEMEKG